MRFGGIVNLQSRPGKFSGAQPLRYRKLLKFTKSYRKLSDAQHKWSINPITLNPDPKHLTIKPMKALSLTL